MKKFIFRFGFFCALFIFGLYIFSTFLKEGQKNHNSSACYKLKIFLDEKSIDTEIIVFGSSVAEGAINPEIISNKTGKTVFNAALSGRRIIDWSSIAFSFIDYTKNNKMIVLDIFPNVFNETDQLYQPHEFYPYLDNKYVKNALAPISETYYKMTRFPFYYFTQLNSKIILNSIIGVRDISFKHLGFKNSNAEYEEGELLNLIKPEISPRSLMLYEQLFSHASAKDIEIFLVGMPIYYKGRELYQNVDKVYNWGEAWSAKYENVKFINFLNDTTIINCSKFFANNTHVNSNGAQHISRKVGIYINSIESN